MKSLKLGSLFNGIFGNRTKNLSDVERKKIMAYVYIILTLITVSFFGLFAISPTLSTITNLQRQYEDNKIIYEALNQKLSNLELLDFQYNTLQYDLPIIYNAIPETARIPRLARQLEDLASQNNVTLTGLDFGTIEIFPNTKNESIYSFTFVLGIEGNQISVNKFMSGMINFDRIIGIERISTGTTEEDRYRAEITGRAYFSSR